MKIRRPVPAKIILGSSGLGLPDPDLLQQRAVEVAAIEGREVANANDWEEARRELHGKGAAGDVTGAVWSSEAEMIATELGQIHEALEMEDDALTGEELVREGMEEAEHERMFLGHELTEREFPEPMEE